jgi:hypothetical protein
MAKSDANRCQHVVARPGCARCPAEVRALTGRVNGDRSRRGFMLASASSGALGSQAGRPHGTEAVDRTEKQLAADLRLLDRLALKTRGGVSAAGLDGTITDWALGRLSEPDGRPPAGRAPPAPWRSSTEIYLRSGFG